MPKGKDLEPVENPAVDQMAGAVKNMLRTLASQKLRAMGHHRRTVSPGVMWFDLDVLKKNDTEFRLLGTQVRARVPVRRTWQSQAQWWRRWLGPGGF